MADSQPTSTPPPNPSTTESQSSIFSQRSRRQFGLYMAGAGFVGLSAFITRRALVRKYQTMLPKFYQPSNRVREVDGSMEAFEALSLATINVFSISMMTTGGLLWAFDISSVDDMRRKVRKQMGLDDGHRDTEAEKELEEWIATVFARMDLKSMAEKDKEVHGEKPETEKKS